MVSTMALGFRGAKNIRIYLFLVVEVDHASDHSSAPYGAKGSAGI